MGIAGIGCCAFMVGSAIQKAQFMPVPGITAEVSDKKDGCTR
jgi:uncharacterized OsmC-like protein